MAKKRLTPHLLRTRDEIAKLVWNNYAGIVSMKELREIYESLGDSTQTVYRAIRNKPIKL